MLNFLALSLLLVELSLELASHSVVAILGFLEVEPDLVDVSKGVQILVLIEKRVSLWVLFTSVCVTQNDLLLQFFILPLESLVLLTFIMDSLNEFLLHLSLVENVFVDAVFILVFDVLLVLIISTFCGAHAASTLARRFTN